MQAEVASPGVIPPICFRDGEIKVLAAKPKPDSWKWACANMRMIEGPFKGHLWNPDVTPHARGIMRAFDDPGVRKIYFIAPSQSAKSTICFACYFNALCARPDNWGIGMPDKESAVSVFQRKLHAYFLAIPALKAMLKKDPNALQGTEIVLADSSITAMWAGSEGSMRSKPMPYVMPDEPDAYPDPGALNVMQERSGAYDGLELSKTMIPCRPKGTEDQSVIWTDATRQAQAWMQYAASCPACSTLQVMEHARLMALDGSRDARRIRQEKLGRYQCEACGYHWNDAMRNQAIRNGRWINIRESAEINSERKDNDYGNANIIAYHFRSWESPLVSLSDVLADWFEAQGSPRLLQLFDNNRCAKPYRFVEIEADWKELRRFKSEYLGQGEVPDWAVALTVAADMQMDYFEWSVAAHGLSPHRLHILDYGTVRSWQDLTRVVFESRYSKATGETYAPWRGALDTGGGRDRDYEDSRTMQAYLWLLAQRPGVIHGTKGMSRKMHGQLVDVRSKEQMSDGRKLRNGFSLHFIDTDAFKRSIFWSLSDGCEEEPITFHAETDDAYLKQIASEKLEKGRAGKEVWKKIRGNHQLDCLVQHKAMACWQWKPGLAQMALAQRAAPPADAGRVGADGSGLFTGQGLFGGRE